MADCFIQLKHYLSEKLIIVKITKKDYNKAILIVQNCMFRQK